MATQAEATTEVRLARAELEVESRRYFSKQGNEIETASQRLLDESLIVFWLAAFSQQPEILSSIRSTSHILSSAIDASVSRSFLAGWERNAAMLGFDSLSGSVVARQHSVQRAEDAMAQIERTTRRELENLVNRTMERANINVWDAVTAATSALVLSAISNKYKRWGSYRSLLIGRTETDNAFEAGKFVLAQAAHAEGWVLEKFWRTMRDNRVMPICRHNESDGWIPLLSQFSSGHLHPLAHVGCRCWTLYRWVQRP